MWSCSPRSQTSLNEPDTMQLWPFIKTAMGDVDPTLIVGLPEELSCSLCEDNIVVKTLSPDEHGNELAKLITDGPENLVLVWDFQVVNKSISRKSRYHLALQTVLAKMVRGSKLLTFIPESFLYSASLMAIRALICEFGWVRLIFNSPADKLGEFSSGVIRGIHPGFRLCGILIELSEQTAHSATQFFQFKPEVPPTKSLLELTNLLGSQRGGCKFGFSRVPPLDPEIPWLPDYHSPTTRKKEDMLSQLGSVVQLGQLATFHASRAAGSPQSTSERKKKLKTIRGRDIHNDGSITPTISDSYESNLQLQEGDLIFRSILPPGAPLAFYEIQVGDLPVFAEANTFVVRPLQTLTKQQRFLLVTFLASKVARDLLDVRSGGISLVPGIIRQLPVPFANEEVSRALEAIDDAKSLFSSWLQEAQEAQDQIFRDALRDPLDPLLTSGRRLRQIAKTGKLVNDLSHRVRTLFPFPVALRWRKVEGAHDDLEGYVEILDAAEALFGFLGSLTLGILLSEAAPLPKKCAEIGKALSNGKGITMGDWKSLLDECAANVPPSSKGALPEILSAWQNQETQGFVKTFLAKRNDHAHGRGPKFPSLQTKFQEAKSELLNLIRMFDCLTDYRLRYVEETRRDSIRQLTNYRYRDLIGDHDVVPLKSGVSEDPDLETHSLYLVSRDRTMKLLRPLLSRLNCQHCGHWSILCLDGPGPRLKSLEHSHHMDVPELKDAFSLLGFF